MSLTSVRLRTNLLSKSRLLMCWWPEGCFSVPVTTASFRCLLGFTLYGLCLHANLDLLPLVFFPFTPVSPLYSFFPPFSSLPISSVGCLYVSETKQTESCVTQCSWETGGPQMSTAASSFVGHVLHSPDVSRRLSLCSGLTLCPCGRETKWGWSVWLKSIIFLIYSASMQNPRGHLQMVCFVWWTNLKTLNLMRISYEKTTKL